MAKQKLKRPLNGAAIRDGAGAAAIESSPAAMVRKRKAKNAPKAKARTDPEAGQGDVSATAGGKRTVKRKPPRRKGVPQKIAEKAAVLVKRLGADGLLPNLPRAKASRPSPLLGRLERLEIAIGEVRIGGRASTRTRKLLASGIHKMAQKVIEEAAEAAIEAIRGDRAAFVNESVDLFYNLLALGSELGVPLTAIWTEMDRREQVLGMSEKLPKNPEA